MNARVLPSLSLLLVVACDPGSKSVGEGESGGAEGSESDSMASDSSDPTMSGTSTGGDSQSGTSAGTTGSATTSGTSDSAPSTTDASESDSSETGSTGETCEEHDCAECPEGSTNNSYCDGDEFVCECIPDTQSECDLEEIVCEMVENGKVLPKDVVDCGTVTLQDGAQGYADLHTCIVEASAQQAAYKGFAELQGIDSNVWVAYGSFVGFAYTEHVFHYDGGGLAGGEFVDMRQCAPVPLDDCVPGLSSLCLFCESEDYNSVCSAPE